jgi:hypothetical protein
MEKIEENRRESGEKKVYVVKCKKTETREGGIPAPFGNTIVKFQNVVPLEPSLIKVFQLKNNNWEQKRKQQAKKKTGRKKRKIRYMFGLASYAIINRYITRFFI